MWKKAFEGGIVLGVISICLLLESHLILGHGFNAYGVALKTIETIGTIGAFGIAIAVSIMVISWFSHFCLSDQN